MTKYAFVEDDAIVGVYDFLPKNWRNFSNFDQLDDWELLNSLGWQLIEKPIPDYNPDTQKLDNPSWHIENGKVIQTLEVIDLPTVPTESVKTPEEIEAERQVLLQQEWNFIRIERDRRMRDFEWRYSRRERQLRLGQLPIDNVSDLDAYMQALADITLQSNPYSLIWPEYTTTSVTTGEETGTVPVPLPE